MIRHLKFQILCGKKSMFSLGICYMLDRYHWRVFNINHFINDPLGSDFMMTPGRSMHLLSLLFTHSAFYPVGN